MATQSKYICQQCGYESAKWLGRCIECGEWNSLVETVVTTTSSAGRIGRTSRKGEGIKPVFLAEVPSKNISRISTKIPELDRVLGGGLVGGQVILIAGEPGIGKSTLLLQVAEELASSQRSSNLGKTKMTKVHRQESSVLYISGEESINQIALRAQRLGINSKRIQIMEETDVDQVIQVVQVEQVGQKIKTNSSTTSATYSALIIDSIQTMATSDLSGMAGSVGQVRECAYRLIRLAKSRNIT